MDETGLVAREDSLVLPSESDVTEALGALKAFHKLVHSQLIENKDYGVIPGTGTKATLLKPGAEQLAKLMGLSDHYEVMNREMDFGAGLIQYEMRCKLVSMKTGVIVAEGVGECNSYESKYRYRWLGPSKLEEHGIDEAMKATMRTRTAGNGDTLYRIDNPDPADQVNTNLKMAKKRALVDAALSAGRLSELFTQDIEDMGPDDRRPSTDNPTSICTEHGVESFMRGKMTSYGHPPTDGGNKWCWIQPKPPGSTGPVVEGESRTVPDISPGRSFKNKGDLFTAAKDLGIAQKDALAIWNLESLEQVSDEPKMLNQLWRKLLDWKDQVEGDQADGQ